MPIATNSDIIDLSSENKTEEFAKKHDIYVKQCEIGYRCEDIKYI